MIVNMKTPILSVFHAKLGEHTWVKNVCMSSIHILEEFCSFFSKKSKNHYTTSGWLGPFLWVIRAICVCFPAVFRKNEHFWSILAVFAAPSKRHQTRKWLKWVIKVEKSPKIIKNRCFQKWSLRVFVHVLGHFGPFLAFLVIFGHSSEARKRVNDLELGQRGPTI